MGPLGRLAARRRARSHGVSAVCARSGRAPDRPRANSLPVCSLLLLRMLEPSAGSAHFQATRPMLPPHLFPTLTPPSAHPPTHVTHPYPTPPHPPTHPLCSYAFQGGQQQAGDEPSEERLAFSLADGRAGVLGIRGRRISDTRPRRPAWQPLANGGAPASAHLHKHCACALGAGLTSLLECALSRRALTPSSASLPLSGCRLQGGGHWLLGALPAAG